MRALIIVFLIIVLIIILKSIRIVPQAQQYIIEFLGSYKKTLDNGLHILIPFVERIAKKVSLKEQVADFPPQPVITKDNVTMQIDTVVYFVIFDAKLFTYGVEKPVKALENLTATTLRNIIGELELDETLTSRDIINGRMRATLDEATDPWGIRVNRVELKNIIPPHDIQEAMEKQMRAEREKRQSILEAEAHKQASVMRAEGDKQAAILKAEAERDAAIARAEGQAQSILKVYQAEAEGLQRLSEVQVSDAVIKIKSLNALKDLVDGQATKLVVPTDLVTSASNLTYIGETLGITSKPASVRKPAPAPAHAKKDECCDDEVKTPVTQNLAFGEGNSFF
ncbi:MAG: SPFH/Band 7/PHB domain protein [Roseburia sp.]|nr:SPFH/Band 7/PHB domain protein [Roseburia sp.]